MFIVFFTMSFCFQLSQMEIFHKSMKLHWDNFREMEESFWGGINMYKIGQLSYSATNSSLLQITDSKGAEA